MREPSQHCQSERVLLHTLTYSYLSCPGGGNSFVCRKVLFSQVSHSVCVFCAGAAEAQWWEEFGANWSTNCSGSGEGKESGYMVLMSNLFAVSRFALFG